MKYEINDSLFEEKKFPILITSRLVLGKLGMSNLNEYYRLRSDPKIAFDCGATAFESIEEAEEMIINSEYSYEFKMGINWAVYLKSEKKFIGSIGIWKIDREHFRGEIGYSLFREYHRKGFMSEALNSVIKVAFEKLELHSLEANVDPDNLASIKLLKKLGFKQEGYTKESYFIDGKFYDNAIFSLLNKE